MSARPASIEVLLARRKFQVDRLAALLEGSARRLFTPAEREHWTTTLDAIAAIDDQLRPLLPATSW